MRKLRSWSSTSTSLSIGASATSPAPVPGAGISSMVPASNIRVSGSGSSSIASSVASRESGRRPRISLAATIAQLEAGSSTKGMSCSRSSGSSSASSASIRERALAGRLGAS